MEAATNSPVVSGTSDSTSYTFYVSLVEVQLVEDIVMNHSMVTVAVYIDDAPSSWRVVVVFHCHRGGVVRGAAAVVAAPSIGSLEQNRQREDKVQNVPVAYQCCYSSSLFWVVIGHVLRYIRDARRWWKETANNNNNNQLFTLTT